LTQGRLLAGKYFVDSLLGAGWEGEVYKVHERKTGATRAAKLFFPHRNADDRAVSVYAQKLERLRPCPIILKYHHSEDVNVRGAWVTALISEFVEGELLESFVRRQPGKRLRPFEALTLLHAIASGLECVHKMREYHGDMHIGNILVRRIGVGFDVRIVDMYDWGKPTAANIQEDVFNLIRILYDMVGGAKRYASQPPEIKQICCGLKRSLIRKRFRTTRDLREHLESFEWSDG
jgi:serine/threonine protein kinase